eukprot:Opistho-2@77276
MQASQYKFNRVAFNENARAYTRKHAMAMTVDSASVRTPLGESTGAGSNVIGTVGECVTALKYAEDNSNGRKQNGAYKRLSEDDDACTADATRDEREMKRRRESVENDDGCCAHNTP